MLRKLRQVRACKDKFLVDFTVQKMVYRAPTTQEAYIKCRRGHNHIRPTQSFTIKKHKAVNTNLDYKFCLPITLYKYTDKDTYAPKIATIQVTNSKLELLGESKIDISMYFNEASADEGVYLSLNLIKSLDPNISIPKVTSYVSPITDYEFVFS